MNSLENIKIALRSIRSNLLRSILTIIVIAIGITALVGIFTAIDVGIHSLQDSFSGIGANSFTIEPKDGMGGNRQGKRSKLGGPITYRQAMEFKDRIIFEGKVAVSYGCTSRAAIKYKDEETSPTVRVMAIDETTFRSRLSNWRKEGHSPKEKC